MTEPEKQAFQWLSQRLYEIAYASAAPATQPLAAALLPILTAEAATIPRVAEALKQMQAVAKRQAERDLAHRGPTAWQTLHTRAALQVADPAAELQWLHVEFPKLVPCGECKQFYFQYLQANKPDFVDYFGWTVGLHNAVNRKVTPPKLEVTVEEARAIWSKGG